MTFKLAFFFVLLSTSVWSQSSYWQQEADYEMDIVLDDSNHQYTATQTIKYTNNSPDELDRLFYHLYFNAFQPESMMDVRSRTIKDPDQRVGDRISKLTPEEYGWVMVDAFSVNGQPVDFEVDGTILDIKLPNPIGSGETATLSMQYKSQVPLQIRRSGRDSAEGISYSMTQWYPKLCAYDHDGWHPNPYVGREFYGNWGDFTVNITAPAKYIIGGSGKLLNPEEVGQSINGDKVGYLNEGGTKTWKFIAENVHDFAWAADPDYTHLRRYTQDGIQIDYYYQMSEKTKENWDNLHTAMTAAIEYMNDRYGQYPYDRYAFIQGGDGGMEYPMATLITGERSYGSLVGVSIHEWMHSWYQMILGTDEAQYAWVDEGFTSFATSEVMNFLRSEEILDGEVQDNPISNSMIRYGEFALSGMEEPLTTHADHFETNAAYGVGSYVKGAVYLKQLEYIIGEEAFSRTLLRFFDEWKFKHPTPKHFLRVAEKESGMILDWYHDYFVNTTKTVDYAIQDKAKGETRKETLVTLDRVGPMPMPLDVIVIFKDGEIQRYYIPLDLTRGEKPLSRDTKVLPDWQWTHPTYSFEIEGKKRNIEKIVIDPTLSMADVNLLDNVLPHLKPESADNQ